LAFIAPGSVGHTVKWVNGLAKSGFEVHLITQHKPTVKLDNKVVIHLLPFSGFKGYFLNNFALHTIIKKISPDVTNVHFATGYGVLAMISRIKPYILSVWGSDVYVAPFRSFLHKWLVKQSLNSACHIASTSHAMADQVRIVLGKSQDVSVTPFGVDMDKFQSTYPICDNQNITIGIVKALEPVYAINILISGFAKAVELLVNVPELQSKLRLMIVGDGSQRNELTELVKHHQIQDKVDFVGRVANSDVPKFINQMDVFAITSKVESLVWPQLKRRPVSAHVLCLMWVG
jgi:glycosyltransferase involved in cell wall biosynthesis